MTDHDPASVALFSLLLSASTHPARAAIYRATLGDLYPVPGDDAQADVDRCARLGGVVDRMMNRTDPGSQEEALYLAALDSLEDLEDTLYPI